MPSEYLPDPEAGAPVTGVKGVAPSKPFIEFYTPSELRGYNPPAGCLIVGDNHIVRGSVFVIGGAPGVGKSRASVALAIAGATGENWFGLQVHRRFKTLIIQNENGRVRLASEFSALDCQMLNDWVRISSPPPYGFAFDRPEFAEQLKLAIAQFNPDVVLIDPWNAAARDDKARDYLDTFELIRSIIPAGESGPALGIVAHTRKPKADERSTGRGLLNLLAGSYVLGSVPRTVFVIQHASDEPEESRIIFTCCKNNDGKLGPASCWERRNGLFVPIDDFNWQEFGSPSDKRRVVTFEDLDWVFDGGKAQLARKLAVHKLMERTGCAQSAAYNALSPDGHFANHLVTNENNILCWRP